jgi:phytanoyl-CoA hydroxylase
MNPKLSAAEQAHYDSQGYVVIRGFFAPDELQLLLDRLEEIVEGRVAPAPDMLVMQDVMVAKGKVAPETAAAKIAKLQDFHNDPVLFEGYTRHPKLLDWIEGFLGPDIKSIHTMLINKPPGVDGRHPLHQDLLYFPFRPADWIVATSTALDRVTRENGCMVVVPGSHRGELLAHGNPDWEDLNFGYFGATEVGAAADRVHLEMEPGDTVFFHPLLLHGAGRNRTSGFRRTILTHYASCRCEFLEGASGVADARPYLLLRGEAHEGRL